MTVTIENTYTQSGSTTDYGFTFPYLDQPDIKVSLDGVAHTNFRLLNATTVQFVNNTTDNTPTAPPAGTAIRIYRDTAYTNPKATFYPGSAIRAGDLNDNTLQNLYVTQEANDKVDKAWLTGDPTVISSETWYTTDDTKIASTKAIENRINSQIDTALTDDVVAGSSITIADNSPSSGKITVSVNAATTSASGSMSASDKSKLDGIESNATADQTNAEIRTAVEAATDSNVFTDADHSKLNAIEASATADQTDAEIRTAVENATDSNVFTDADHTKLNGIEASATADQTAAEIKTAYESNAQTNPLTDAEKAVIDGVTANTSELNKLDGVTATTTQLNIVSGKTFRASGDGTLSTTSDTEIPSSKVIATHVASAVSNVGGFVTIANEISFPTTANQPANGVIVSISDAAGTVINGSGVSTTGRTTDGTPATVTINNFPSSLNSETLASGVALLVTSTGSSNTYNYHKILAAETDVKSLSDDINDFNARYRVAGSAPGSNNDDGDLWFDTSANKMKVYNATGSSWDDVASVGQFFINTISSSSGTGGGSATFNGSAYRFTLSNPATGGASQLLVSVNGVLQKPNGGSSQPSEGFAIDGNDIIFSAAPASGSDYFIVTQGSSVSIGTPSANSVNSSHIIDGSIVNADISNSAAIASTKLAEIPGSKIADDSIAEAKLDISNTPTDGKFLQYKDDTDKLTWSSVETVPSEVTISANNTTDETVYPTFVDGATGAQGIETDTGLTYNPHTGLLSAANFSGNGSALWNLNYQATGNTGLVGTANMGSGTASSSTFLRGDRSWQEIAAAPEVELTADGAIGNNVACNVKSNGKVEAVTEVAAGANHVASATNPSGGSADNVTTTYDREHNKIVTFFRHDNDLKCVVGTPSGSGSTSTFTWGSVQTLHDSHTSYRYMTAEYIHYNDTNKHIVAWINGTSGNVALYTMVVDIDSSGNATAGTANHVVSAGNSGANLRTKKVEVVNGHESTYPFILFYIESTSAGLKSCDGSINAGANTNSTAGATNALASGNYNDPIYAFKYLDRNTVVAKNSSSQWYYNTRITGSWKSTEAFGSTSIGRLTMFYDSTSSKVFAFYLESGTLKWKSGTPTTAGSGITNWSSETTIRTTVSSWTGSQQIVEYDTKNSKYWLMFSEDSPAQKTYLYGFTISSGGAITWDSSPKEIAVGQKTAENLFYETSLMNMVATSNVDNYTSYSASSTMDTSNFLGWSAAAASDGATAKVKVVGNTVTGLSGLTPGKKYYVQRDGSVGLTPVAGLSVEAGLALTSSSLLIK